VTTHYIELTIQPDPDFAPHHLMGALFSKLHRRLVELDRDDIGTSFPQHRVSPKDIGNTLRIHGDTTALDALMAKPWLQGMREHVRIGEMAKPPADARHRIVRRRQFKTNAERLRRRHMRRHDVSAQAAMETIPDSVERKVPLPFVQMRSASTNQSFSLFVEHGQECEQPQQGQFNSYGLSNGATVPWF